MGSEQTGYRVHFKHSGQTVEVSLAALQGAVISFLDRYAVEPLLGKEFCGAIGSGNGQMRFERLLDAARCAADPAGFFAQVISRLEAAHGDGTGPIAVNGFALPYLLLLAILEQVLPEERLYTVENLEQLEKLTNTCVPPEDRATLQKVLDTYPVRLSSHVIRQMRLSRPVGRQYLPFAQELDADGLTHTWVGQFRRGVIERMYRNRVILLINMTCPVYCRFCFRKHKESRHQPNPSRAEVVEAVEYVRCSPEIKEVLVTGGDPLLNRANLAAAIDGLRDVAHVRTVRLATRSIAYYPQFFQPRGGNLLQYLLQKSTEFQQRGKRLEVATHFVHPDEVSVQSLELISQLVSHGIPVYVQTPLLNGCNDQGPELVRLFSLLRGAGAEIHYLFIPCDRIHGNRVYETPIAQGIELARQLRAHLCDRAMPRVNTGTPIGKIEWHSSGWAVEQDRQDPDYVWIRTPYTADYFEDFAPTAKYSRDVRVNREGTFDARYMARIGDETLFLGARPVRPISAKTCDMAALRELQTEALADQRLRMSIVATGCAGLYRLHATRVELDAEADPAEDHFDYIQQDPRITDVVLASRSDALANLHRIGRIVERLRAIQHVNAVRLRSLHFNYRPTTYTSTVIDVLASLNKLSGVLPLRLEIETQFLHPAEFCPRHADLAGALRKRGITVYNNTPLLSSVNDTADSIRRIAHACRQSGIEFHHLYIAGWLLQPQWNQNRPVDLQEVVDIASTVRREGSGRELPRYIILTELGEVDFGLTSTAVATNGTVLLKLLPYSIEYYRSMQATFRWPAGVRVDERGRPVVTVSGIAKGTDFALC